MSGISKSTKTESRLVVARGRGEGGIKSDFTGRGFLFRVMEVFWN